MSKSKTLLIRNWLTHISVTVQLCHLFVYATPPRGVARYLYRMYVLWFTFCWLGATCWAQSVKIRAGGRGGEGKKKERKDTGVGLIEYVDEYKVQAKQRKQKMRVVERRRRGAELFPRDSLCSSRAAALFVLLLLE